MEYRTNLSLLYLTRIHLLSSLFSPGMLITHFLINSLAISSKITGEAKHGPCNYRKNLNRRWRAYYSRRSFSLVEKPAVDNWRLRRLQMFCHHLQVKTFTSKSNVVIIKDHGDSRENRGQ